MKERNFKNLSVNSMSRRFLPYDGKRTKDFLDLSRSELRAITGFLTGHCWLKSHMCKLGLMQDDSCRRCVVGRETAEHLLCHCPAIAAMRLKQSYFGLDYPEPKQLIGVKPRKILKFFRELRLVVN